MPNTVVLSGCVLCDGVLLLLNFMNSAGFSPDSTIGAATILRVRMSSVGLAEEIQRALGVVAYIAPSVVFALDLLPQRFRRRHHADVELVLLRRRQPA